MTLKIISLIDLSFHIYIKSNKGKSNICVINDHGELISDNHYHISSIMLKVRYKEGDIVEKDCSCNDTSWKSNS